MAATKSQLITALSAKIAKGLNDAELKRYNEYFQFKETILPCQNTREIKITMMIPNESNAKGEKFFKYSFVGHSGDNDHLAFDALSEQLLEIGYQNRDISVLSPAELTAQGFVPEDGTNICAISNMLVPDNYKLVMTGERYYGQDYEAGHDGQPYYGPTYRDIFERENLTIFDKVIAHRDVKIGTQTVSDYVGD